MAKQRRSKHEPVNELIDAHVWLRRKARQRRKGAPLKWDLNQADGTHFNPAAVSVKIVVA
jgi:hypothetical protein